MPISDLLNIRPTNPSGQLAQLYNAFRAVGVEPSQVRQDVGTPGGFARLAGSYTIDPIVDFGETINRLVSGEATPYDLANLSANLAGTGATSGVVSGLRGAGSKNVVSMFVAPTKKEIADAEGMIKKGATRDEVHKKLLMHKKPDGLWRKEISDTPFLLSEIESDFLPVSTYPEEAFTHPEFKKRYPEIWDETLVNLTINPRSNVRGSYRPGTPGDDVYFGLDPEISIVAPDYQKGEKVALHELQHAVQEKEGFAKGGDPKRIGIELQRLRKEMDFHTSVSALVREAIQSTGGNLDKAAKELADIGIDITQEHIDQAIRVGEKEAIRLGEESQQRLKMLIGSGDGDAYSLYRNLLGEREARDTAERRNLSLYERSKKPPDFGEDAIIR